MSALTIPEERQARREHTGHLIFWTGTAIFFVALLCLLSMLIGQEFGYQKAKAEYMARPMPTRPAPATALTQWTCTKQEFREHLHACGSRERMARIKART